MIRPPLNRSMIAAAVVVAIAVILVLVIRRTSQSSTDHTAPSGASASSRQRPGSESSATPLDSKRTRQEEENRELSRKLKDTRAELDRVRREADFRGEVAQELAGEPDPAPETDDELASSMGDMRRQAIEFSTKWPDGIPAEGTPERAVYDAEKQATARDMANFLKWLGDGRMGGISSDPQKLARFQAMQVSGALGLSEYELHTVEAALRSRYSEGFDQGLNSAAKPAGPLDKWNEQRRTLSQEAAREIGTQLPAEKRKLFERVFGNDFLWSISFGG